MWDLDQPGFNKKGGFHNSKKGLHLDSFCCQIWSSVKGGKGQFMHIYMYRYAYTHNTVAKQQMFHAKMKMTMVTMETTMRITIVVIVMLLRFHNTIFLFKKLKSVNIFLDMGELFYVSIRHETAPLSANARGLLFIQGNNRAPPYLLRGNERVPFC